MFSAIALAFAVPGRKLGLIQPKTCLNRTIEMKRVIRHTRTGEFFNAGAWTRSSALAQDFPDTRELLITCAEYHLSDVELVLALGFEAPGTCDICVPLPPSD
jgi:hypothetical protein